MSGKNDIERKKKQNKQGMLVKSPFENRTRTLMYSRCVHDRWAMNTINLHHCKLQKVSLYFFIVDNIDQFKNIN